jgi:SAM-dependent methyltransferase
MIRTLERLVSRLPGWSALRAHPAVRRALGFEDTIWTRKVADREVRRLVAALDPAPASVLEISGEVWRGHGFPAHRSTRYPGFDLEAEPLAERFDLVIAEHVLEHLRHPHRAARNAMAMLRPGGAFLVVTPFLYRVHPCPDDFSRWTENGLAQLLAGAGFPLESTVTGSWGNRACVRSTLTRHEHRSYNRWVHPLRDEREFPVVVWALARAPAPAA